MTKMARTFLMLGSPRTPKKSTSESLGSFLLGILAEKGVETSFVHVHRAVRTDHGMEQLLEEFFQAELVILACPLYVDSLPAPVIRVMERLAEELATRQIPQKRFAAIINCGFPEPRHIEVALAICDQFARETGMRWEGGLAVGGGEAIGGRSLREAGGLARRIRKSLQLTAESLAAGNAVPEEAKNLLSKPIIPSWLYRWVGDLGWKRKARPYGVQRKLTARPFQPDDH